MNAGVFILALLSSMLIGALLAVLVDTFYLRRWHEASQADKSQLDDALRRRTSQLSRAEANYATVMRQLRAYQRELAEEQKEVERLDEARAALETRLETAVAETAALKAELKQFDDEMDALRDEKVELARQLTVTQIEMKYLTDDLAEHQQQLASLEQLEAENQRLAATLAVMEKELAERKAKVDELLNQITETERLRTSLQQTEAELQTTHSQLNNVQSALGRAKSQIKHTGKSQLQIIKGIGPVTERKLKAAGIVTVPDLAGQTPERLREILDLKATSRSDPEAWVAEARQLASTFDAEEITDR